MRPRLALRAAPGAVVLLGCTLLSTALPGAIAARAEERPASEPAARSGRRSEPAAGGKVLYERFCASCHGASGRGDGPVASSLKAPPPDLTQLAARNGGKLDEAALMAVIDGRRTVAAHGPREMPVWGAVFDAELQGQPFAQRTGLLRARVLADYLATLQQPGS